MRDLLQVFAIMAAAVVVGNALTYLLMGMLWLIGL
jgi:hypothetical protein